MLLMSNNMLRFTFPTDLSSFSVEPRWLGEINLETMAGIQVGDDSCADLGDGGGDRLKEVIT